MVALRAQTRAVRHPSLRLFPERELMVNVGMRSKCGGVLLLGQSLAAQRVGQ